MVPTDVDNEVWLPVRGFPDYEVSNQGRVRRATAAERTHAGFVLKPSLMPQKKYYRVCLRRDKKSINRPVHRIVLETFLGMPKPGQEGRHLSGDAADNRLVNLTWGTAAENAYDKLRHGTNSRVLTWSQVLEIRSSPESYRQLGARYGVHKLTIRDIKTGRSWRAEKAQDTARGGRP
jgi:hypothetical protein